MKGAVFYGAALRLFILLFERLRRYFFPIVVTITTAIAGNSIAAAIRYRIRFALAHLDTVRIYGTGIACDTDDCSGHSGCQPIVRCGEVLVAGSSGREAFFTRYRGKGDD
ncbi:MAG: hypothetical protein A3E38_02885 [Candidatus Moranbacteria bacterium RIFCSPHIGHO2_12_FULL_54_9]|nr:MAG: hypothetical protein A3E38_02885 [Candidatus Moranbacteria bacterium RIFCSPHIGHO2_12_FULL_54_9]